MRGFSNKTADSTRASCHLSEGVKKFDLCLRPLKNQQLTGARNRDLSILSQLLIRHILRHCLLPPFTPKISKSIRALARSLPLPPAPFPLPLLSLSYHLTCHVSLLILPRHDFAPQVHLFLSE